MDEHISYFQGWPDKDFAIWLAVFIDGEGCIHLPRTPGVEVSVANTNRDIVHSIHDRIGCGNVRVTHQTRPGWKTKYSWRIRDAKSVRRVLVLVMPYLTFKRQIAIEALGKIRHLVVKEDARRELVDRVFELRAEGKQHKEIGALVGLSRASVTVILNQPHH